ncbi:MAG TPA: acyl-CoA dehydrogenase, partial [Streptomyces sp.]
LFPTLRGEKHGFFGLTEPSGGSDPARAIRTTAYRDGDEWVLNGRKAWASHLCGWDGDGPDLMTVVCRTPGGISLVVAEREHLAGHVETEAHYDLPGLKGCLTTRIRLAGVRVPRANLLGAEGDGARLTRNAFFASGASIGSFAVAAMREAWDIAYRFALTEKRGGAVPIIDHQAVSDVLADTKGKIEATRLLSWRALDAVLAGDPAAPELALHAMVFGSETAVAVVNDLVKIVGVTAYDAGFPLFRHLTEALAYPVIEGSNTGVRRRQLHTLFTTTGYDPLAASGLA